MEEAPTATNRTMGPWGATGVGVGAIVGGGIMALAGASFSATGPSAILAFALNGVIALVTAMSFAEMSTRFPESGGTYTFAKKVFPVQSAFTMGWVVWFASIAAAALYALGFAFYAAMALSRVWTALFDESPGWLTGRLMVTSLAVAAILFYMSSLMRRIGGGGQWETVGKVIVFGFLILGGLVVLAMRPGSLGGSRLSPFFSSGAVGLFKAMGFTFIALQGFDIIAAVGGEVRDPDRNLPRSMFMSLAAALLIYIPLLFVISTVGVPDGTSIAAMSAAQPETVMAAAVQNYLGPAGYWGVIAAAILAMLSALKANIMAASRVAHAMARDRTLPAFLSRTHKTRGTPRSAVLVSALLAVVLIAAVPDVASMGAAASLIFLISFTMVHWTSILARMRAGTAAGVFVTPWFPLVPLVGILACGTLALFQGVAVPSAGLISGGWVLAGVSIYIVLFARRARLFDASSEAFRPTLVQLRGKSPFVLVPIANPASAEAMVTVASALAPPGVGKALLLSVVSPPESWRPGEPPPSLRSAQELLGEILSTCFASGVSPEALITVARNPWEEIVRVAKSYGCESLLLGLSDLSGNATASNLEDLMGRVDSDVVVLRAPEGWKLSETRRVLVPVGGAGGHDMLRARLLGSLGRTGDREVTFMRIVSENFSEKAVEKLRRSLLILAGDETPGRCRAEVHRSSRVADLISGRARESDLVILGLQRLGRRQKVVGEVAMKIAQDSRCALIMIGRR
jgi:APA family basic amino acid/polyamine antiporter